MTSRSTDTGEVTKVGDERPEAVRLFTEVRPQYEQLCNEIARILRERMSAAHIEYCAMTCRAKAIASFAEKLSRKHYTEPLKEVTDLAGVRLVYLYRSDRPAIEKQIEMEFDVLEKVDKLEEQEADEFGYGALHYLVRLGEKSAAARYLKGMICEIQVRTVLQDAWAIIDHHLSYKQESDVPKGLQRQLNSLSGLFEIADDQFDRVRAEREAYRQAIRSKLGSADKFLDQEINLDTFREFLVWRFPGQMPANNDKQLSKILAAAIGLQYTKLADLDELLRRTEPARVAINSKNASSYASLEIARALALVHQEFRASGWAEDQLALFREHEHLLS